MGLTEILSILFLLRAVHAQYYCPVSQCGKNGVFVRFPFRLEGSQLPSCGYPGFNLSCNSNQGLTVLTLPYSGEFIVRDISYLTQQVQLYDSEKCLPKRLMHLNLSDSPFVALYQNYTFLTCQSEAVKSLAVIDCLSNSTTSVLATSSLTLANSMSKVCQIMVTLPIPVSWQVQSDGGFSTALNDDLQLAWYTPDCQQCEQEGGMCGFQGNTSLDVGCFFDYTSGKAGLQILRIIGLTIVAPSVLMGIGVAFCAYLSDRYQWGNTVTTARVANTVPRQASIAMVGLDESTIQSYQKLVLGESKRIPGPNDSTCAICLSEYNTTETVKCIPECNHCFHADCIDEWLRMNGSCPVCRKSPLPAHLET